MLNQVLREIENSSGPITVRKLSRKMGVEPDALEGMIQFWVRKGRLQVDQDEPSGANCSCDPSSNDCAPVSDCVFIAKMPNSYSTRKK